ncbi:MAG: N-acetylmuramoyl-L-alanine amidase [Candidatus Melainabacteria bacterium]|nr:N-acetylmuramoyl-L-alanine amidase [Candidatus Melainabacteria bacterium]
MVADFNDVVFPYSTRVINVNATPIAGSATMGSAERSGIKLVRIGKFQDSPPVCRVAIVSSDPAKLRAVTFDSRPGSLLIKWPKSSTMVANGFGMPPQAPSFRGRSAPQHGRAHETDYIPPPVFPPTGEMDPNLSEIPQVSQGRIDPEIASANNGLGLRGAMPEPTNPQNNSRQYINPQFARREAAQGLAASAQSLNKQAPIKVASTKTGPASDQAWKPVKTAASKTNSADSVIPKVAPDRFGAARLNEQANQPEKSSKWKKNSQANSQTAQKWNADKARVAPPIKPRDEEIAQAEPIAEEKTDSVSSLFSKVKDRAKRFLSTSENPDNQTQAIEVIKTDSKKSIEVVTPEKKDEVARAESNDNSKVGNTSKDGMDNQSSATQDDGEPPAVFLTQSNSGSGYKFKIVSPDKRDLNFSSFRLHNPERFVIDLEGLRSVQNLSVPQPDNTDMLKAIRVGAPDPAKNTGRLVLDLSGAAVSVIPGDAASVNEVSFVIGESSDPLVGLSSPPGSVVVIDAGHGGTDPGAQRGYVKEKELTLAIAKKTRDKLVENGVKVVMTRGDDTFVALPERVNITNKLKPDIFLSVHINSLESTNDIHGIETYYQTDMSKALAQQVHDSLVSELTAPDRAIRKAKFYVINRAEVPAVLAEVGFISNKAERDKLVSDDYQEKIAGALAKGAILYLKQHSSVAAKISRTSDQSSDSAFHKQVGSTIPRASELVHKGLGIKSH